MQLDDDVELKKIVYLNYFFYKGKQNIAVAPKYINKFKLSKIYRKPDQFY